MRVVNQQGVDANVVLNADGSVPVSGGTGGGVASTVAISQTTPGTTNGVQVNASALPAGAATASNQATQITAEQGIQTSAASIDTKTPAKGAATTANSTPVNLASDQTVPVSAAALPLPTGAATAASQTNVQSAPGTPQTAALTVQGNSAGVPIPVTSTSTDIAPATQNITAQDVASTSTAVANGGAFITGTPTANSAASFAVASKEAAKYEVTGTWTGTLAIEQSIDGGTTWVTVGVHQNGTGYTTNNFTNNFIGGQNCAGATNVRARATAAWTGTATVKVVLSQNPSSVYVANALSIQDAVTATSKLVIKAASTPAAAADTAAVVSLSPNSGAGGCATGTKSNVASSASSVTLLAANAARKQAAIFNDSTQILFLDLSGGTASASSYSVQLQANNYFELPVPPYTGAITGIWGAANGNARVTEFT